MSASSYQLQSKLRKAGVNLEATYVDTMLASYNASLTQLDGRIQGLTKRIGDLRDSGTEPSLNQVLLLEQYQSLQNQIQAEYNRIAVDETFPQVTSLASEAIGLGALGADAALEQAGYTDYASLGNAEQSALLESFVAGGDLAKAVDAIPGNSKQTTLLALASALTIGQNPLETARKLRSELAGRTKSQVETLARTTQMGAQREASIAHYNNNDDVIDGWIWMAAMANVPGPCLACMAQHGTIHPLDEQMTSHPNCRCTAAPHVKDSFVEIQTGEEWFKSLSPEQQRKVLGPGRYAKFADGDFNIKDLVSYSDGKYGVGMFVTPLKSLPGGRPNIRKYEKDLTPAEPEHVGGTAAYSKTNHKEMNEEYGDWLDAVKNNSDLNDGVANYIFHGNKYVNKYLRYPDTHGLDADGIARSIEMQKNLDQAFAISSATTNNDIIVYRGGRGIVANVGDTIEDAGYVSTSLNEQTPVQYLIGSAARGSDAAMWEIRVPKGTNAAYLGNPAQEEFLLPRGTQMRIISITDEAFIGGAFTAKRIVAEIVVPE